MTSRRATPLYDKPAARTSGARGVEPVLIEPVDVQLLGVHAASSPTSTRGLAERSGAEPVGGAGNHGPGSPASVNGHATALGTAEGAAANGVSTNGLISPTKVLSSAEVLAPVREGLERVEQRLRRGEGQRSSASPATNEQSATVFAPLSNAFLNLIDSGGKRLRPALALLAAQVGVAPERASAMATDDRVISLAASVEMLHTSTLVHDDVIDGALLRRGAPTLNALWSGGSTVLAGNYMFGTAAQFAAATGNMAVIHLFSDTLSVIVDGELRQLRDRYNYDQPRDSYGQRIYAKTASLFCAATQGGAILANLPDEQVAALRDYGYHLGMAFQVVDDILDFTGDTMSLGKPAGSDLLQGTLTLPFFHYLQAHPQPEAFIEELERAREGADDENDAIWRAAVFNLVADLSESSAIDAARIDAQRSLDAARAALAPFAPSVAKSAMLALCDFVLQRTY